MAEIDLSSKSKKVSRKASSFKDNKWFKPTRIIVIFLVVLVVSYLLVVFGVGTCYMRRGADTEIPEVVGYTYQEAEMILKSHNLVAENAGEVDSNLPVGYVVEQSPAAGMVVREGRTIKLKVSSGTGLVHVPDLMGRSVRQAEIVLGKLGLYVGDVSEVHDETVPEGGIIDQTPKPHETIARGGKIDLLVSMGSEKATILVPSVVGLDVSSAQKQLAEFGLLLGEVVKEKHPETPSGKIIRQNPPMGSQIKKGDKINVVIAE